MYARECQILWTEASKRGSTIDSCDNGWFWQWVVETIEKVTFVFLMLLYDNVTLFIKFNRGTIIHALLYCSDIVLSISTL
jgi:hypothetical protein